MVEKSLSQILKPISDIFYSEKRSIRYIILLTLLFNLFLLMIPFSIQAFINQLAIQVYQEATLALFAVFSGLVILVSVLRLAQIEVVERLERRIFVKTSLYFAQYFSAIKEKMSEGSSSRQIFHRFFEVFSLEKAFAKTLVDGIQFIMQFAMGLIIVSFYHQFFLIYSLILLATLWLSIVLISRKIIILGLNTSDKKYNFLAWLEQLSFNQKLFFSNQGQDLALRKVEEKVDNFLSFRESFFKNYFRQVKWIFLIQIIGGLLFLSLGGFLVFKQFITLGQFIAAELIVTYLLLALGKLPSLLESIYGAIISTQKLYGKISEEPVKSTSGLNCSKNPHQWEIRGLSLHSSSTRTLFEKLSMTFSAQKHSAVLAPVGAGKSIFCQILLNLEAPIRGEVLLDGLSLNSYNPRSLHEAVAFVGSDVQFFSGTVKDNLSFDTHTVNHIRSVMKSLGLIGIMSGYSQQFDTLISHDGSPLSDNEAKCLMVLRGVLQNAGTIIFDGVLDDLEENLVEKLLSYLRLQKTTVIVTTTKDVIAKKMDGIFQWKNEKNH